MARLRLGTNVDSFTWCLAYYVVVVDAIHILSYTVYEFRLGAGDHTFPVP